MVESFSIRRRRNNGGFRAAIIGGVFTKDVNMNGRMRFKGPMLRIIPVAVMLLFVLCCGICSADFREGNNPPDQGSAPLVSGETVFEGYVEGGDGIKGSGAKGGAVAAAERSALLEAVRPVVHPTLFIRERDFLLKVLMQRKGDILEGARIVSEEGTESGGYKVLLGVRVRGDIAESALLAHLGTRIILLTSEVVDGKASKENALGNALASLARKRGLKVVDLRGLYDDQTKGLISAFRSGDREAMKPLCLYLLAGAVMEGRVTAAFSEKTEEIYSSRAEGSLRVTKAGKDAVTFAVRGVKGFGSNGRKANLDAAEKASAALSFKGAKYLSGRQKKK
jgi:hypothetical protein